jgi:hypothetical protein
MRHNINNSITTKAWRRIFQGQIVVGKGFLFIKKRKKKKKLSSREDFNVEIRRKIPFLSKNFPDEKTICFLFPFACALISFFRVIDFALILNTFKVTLDKFQIYFKK